VNLSIELAESRRLWLEARKQAERAKEKEQQAWSDLQAAERKFDASFK
jgi:hypothetical protein